MRQSRYQSIPFAIGLLLVSVGMLYAETVKLVDSNGREIQANLLSLEDGEVKIRMSGRGTFNLKLESLSEESQALVESKFSKGTDSDNPGSLVLAKELVIEDPLTNKDWDENWKGGKGDFYAKEDRVVGVEDPSENHSAGAGRRQVMRAAIVQVEFRYDESDQMGIVIDFKADSGNKYDNQHVMKLQIRAGKFSLWGGQGWSDQTRRTMVGKPKSVTIREGWNTVAIEFIGKQMVGHLNGEVVCFGSTEEPIQAPKNQITLTANGTVSYRNLKMWSGDGIHPDWQKTSKELARKL